MSTFRAKFALMPPPAPCLAITVCASLSIVAAGRTFFHSAVEWQRHSLSAGGAGSHISDIGSSDIPSVLLEQQIAWFAVLRCSIILGNPTPIPDALVAIVMSSWLSLIILLDESLTMCDAQWHHRAAQEDSQRLWPCTLSTPTC